MKPIINSLIQVTVGLCLLMGSSYAANPYWPGASEQSASYSGSSDQMNPNNPQVEVSMMDENGGVVSNSNLGGSGNLSSTDLYQMVEATMQSVQTEFNKNYVTPWESSS
jgi:hypothetical protein